jgi:ABC-type transport system involved in multi-copper enzyme maturation permease subunit
METKRQNLFSYLKTVFVYDAVNRILLVLIFLFSAAIYLIWSNYIVGNGINVFMKVQVNPIKFLFFVIIVNLLLSAFSYQKEKEISYLLMIGSIIVTILVFALEIFYLQNFYV